jgi:hypothetical protein
LSKNLVKAGIQYAGGRKQRWLCKDCGRVFIAPPPVGVDLKAIARTLKKHGAKRAVLFGSYARGQPQPGSDVDIWVPQWSGRPPGIFEEFEIEEELSRKLGVPVDLGVRLKPGLEERVKREGVVILSAEG